MNVNGYSDHLHITYVNGYPEGSTTTDSAIATGNYYLYMRLPDEFGTSHKTQAITPIPIAVDIASPGYAGYGSGVPCTWNAPSVYW